jgi:hypothetical protein
MRPFVFRWPALVLSAAPMQALAGTLPTRNLKGTDE